MQIHLIYFQGQCSDLAYTCLYSYVEDFLAAVHEDLSLNCPQHPLPPNIHRISHSYGLIKSPSIPSKSMFISSPMIITSSRVYIGYLSKKFSFSCSFPLLDPPPHHLVVAASHIQSIHQTSSHLPSLLYITIILFIFPPTRHLSYASFPGPTTLIASSSFSFLHPPILL